jgi:hypothetical protein
MPIARSAAKAGRALVCSMLVAGCGVVRIAPAPVALRASDTTHASPPRGQRFYNGKSVGSESQFNPLSLVINEGFDMLRTADANRRVFDLNYRLAAHGAWMSMTRPDRVIDVYGFDTWVRRQLLPLTGKAKGGGQWVPNYELHLFGGGMTGVRITEWYQQHGVAHPELAAAGTAAVWHVMNEMIEHQGGMPTADAMTDLLVFDPAAFLIWRSDWVQRAFSSRVEMTNWPGQPVIAVPTETLQNAHQTVLVRGKTWRNYRPMTTLGASFLLGLSRRKGPTDWVTFGAGWDPTENPIVDPVTGEKTVTLNPNFALFYDRDASLLAAAYVRVHRTELVTMNVYPGVIHFGRWSPGLFAHVLDDGRVRFGIVPRFGLGLGAE